jgi:hypothetical protein
MAYQENLCEMGLAMQNIWSIKGSVNIPHYLVYGTFSKGCRLHP